MSYLVLARKYRPRDFEALVGQEHVVQALANALTQQRLHHAYLFTGTRGVGKTTVSRILAKSLNCVGPDGTGGITARPCGVCHACRDIDSGRFVDYVELDAASNRGVEEISQLLDQSVYKPVVGRFKVYMIDEVHMLSSHAFNAMLKTLEEPPEYLKFVLATTDPQKLPPTVLSRCLQFNLRPMAPQTVHEHLTAVLAQEQIPADVGSLRLLSQAARGSMRDALSLTDQAIAFGAGKLEQAAVRLMLGAVDRTHAVRIVEALAAGQGGALVAVVNGLRSLGLSATGTLEEMAALLQQMAVVKVVPDAADESDPDTPAAQHLGTLLDADEIQLIYSIALHGRSELGLAPDEYSGLVMVLLRMLAFMPASRPARADRGRPPDGAPARGAVGSLISATSSAAAIAGPPTNAPQAAPASKASQLGAQSARQMMPGPSTNASQEAPALNASQRADQPARQTMPGSSSSSSSSAVAPPTQPSTSGSAPAPGARPQGAVLPAAARADVRPPSAPAPVAAAMPNSPAMRVRAPMPEPPSWLDVPIEGDVSSWSGDMRPSDEGDPVDAASPSRASTSGGASPARPAEPTAKASPSASPAMPNFTRTPFGDRWAEVVREMSDAGTILAMVRELALQSQCVAIETDGGVAVWKIRVERETLRGTASCDKLQAALAQNLQQPVRLETESGPTDDTPARRDALARAERQRRAEEIIESDPLVQALMLQYKSARIVPGSVKPH